MNYNILTNSTYLYLLQNPTVEIKYTNIAKAVGLTRQTVAKEYQYLLANNIDYTQNVFGIKNFYAEVPNSTERAICIYLDLFGLSSIEEVAEALGVAPSTVGIYFKSAKARTLSQNNGELTRSGVYALIANNKIIYIGSTSNLLKREQEHYQLLTTPPINTTMGLYHQCQEDGIK